MEQAMQATKEEIEQGKRRCWSQTCDNRAWFWDWCGWHWCFKHWWRQVRSRDLSFWWQIKHTRIG